MLQIVFYNRSFSYILNTPFNWEVDSFDWDLTWGPTLATLTSEDPDTYFEMSKFLRCPVEILNEDGLPVWWGFVHTVNSMKGQISVGTTLENMFNKCKTIYNDPPVDTGWAQADESINEYGTKEHVEVMTDTTAAAATARRDRILREYKYPSTVIEPYSSGGVKLLLHGWGDAFSWMHVSDASTTLTETTTQILNIVSSCGQFMTGTHIFTASGITTSPYQDGTVDAKKVIEDLLKSGTSAGGRLKAIVSPERYLRIEEVTTPSEPDYQMRDDGKLEGISDAILNDEQLELAIGKWAAVKDTPSQIGDFSAVHPFLIEGASWQKGRGATYRPVGQTDALSLSQATV